MDNGIGERSTLWKRRNAPNGIRIRVCGLKGRCPRPLDDGGTRVCCSEQHCRQHPYLLLRRTDSRRLCQEAPIPSGREGPLLRYPATMRPYCNVLPNTVQSTTLRSVPHLSRAPSGRLRRERHRPCLASTETSGLLYSSSIHMSMFLSPWLSSHCMHWSEESDLGSGNPTRNLKSNQWGCSKR